jgi:hypothetical protein
MVLSLSRGISREACRAKQVTLHRISNLDEERLARYANTANGALWTHRIGVFPQGIWRAHSGALPFYLGHELVTEIAAFALRLASDSLTQIEMSGY